MQLRPIFIISARLLLPVFTMTLASVEAFANSQTTCVPGQVRETLLGEEAYPFAHLELEALDSRSPRLKKFLENRHVLKLLESRDELFHEISNHIANDPLKLEGQIVKVIANGAHLELELSKQSETLEVRVNLVSFFGIHNVVGELFEKKSQGPDFRFPKILLAIAEGVDRRIASDPSITEVLLAGTMVKNARLVELLQKLGFESTVSRETFLTRAKTIPQGRWTALGNFLLQSMGAIYWSTGSLREMGIEVPARIIKGAAMTSSSVIKMNAAWETRNLSKDWELRLRLTRGKEK